MKKFLFTLTLCVGSGLLLAQAPAQNPLLNDPTPGDRSIGPGDPNWKGETIQVSAAPPGSRRRRSGSGGHPATDVRRMAQLLG